VRILYIHVPAAWLGMAGWSGVAFASLGYLIWRHPLAHIAARATAPAGAVFAALCLITGSIWGRPTWGTWWEWDGRLTACCCCSSSMSPISRWPAPMRSRRRWARASIVRRGGIGAAADRPLFGGVVEHAAPGAEHRADQLEHRRLDAVAAVLHDAWLLSLFFGAVVLMRMRAMLATQKIEARMRRMAAHEPWPFIIAAYAVTLRHRRAGAGAWLSMRRARRRRFAEA
jgi:heme exporter protein C